MSSLLNHTSIKLSFPQFLYGDYKHELAAYSRLFKINPMVV